MKYPIYNFNLYQGTDEYIAFSFYSLLNNNIDKDFIDFTNSKFKMTIRNGFQNDVLDTLTLDNDRIKIGKITEENKFTTNIGSDKPSAIQIKFPHEITTTKYTKPKLVYDIFRIMNDEQELLLYGTINIIKGVNNG